MQPSNPKVQITISENMSKNKILILCHPNLHAYAIETAELLREDLEDIHPEDLDTNY